DEAEVAAAMGKLISVLLNDFKAKQTPLGFRSYQAIAINDDQAIERALRRRGLSFAVPVPAVGPQTLSVEEAPPIPAAGPQILSVEEGPVPVAAPQILLAKEVPLQTTSSPQSGLRDDSDEAAREEEAWKFVLAKNEKKLVADFLKEFPNSKYVGL